MRSKRGIKKLLRAANLTCKLEATLWQIIKERDGERWRKGKKRRKRKSNKHAGFQLRNVRK